MSDIDSEAALINTMRESPESCALCADPSEGGAVVWTLRDGENLEDIRGVVAPDVAADLSARGWDHREGKDDNAPLVMVGPGMFRLNPDAVRERQGLRLRL